MATRWCIIYTWNEDPAVYHTPQNDDSAVYLTPQSLCKKICFAIFSSLVTLLKQFKIQKSHLLARLGGISYTARWPLRGVRYTAETISNLNISANFRKKSKSSQGTSNGTRRSFLMKKTNLEKSRDTVPF